MAEEDQSCGTGNRESRGGLAANTAALGVASVEQALRSGWRTQGLTYGAHNHHGLAGDAQFGARRQDGIVAIIVPGRRERGERGSHDDRLRMDGCLSVVSCLLLLFSPLLC
jgi:hypothetical protein